MTAVPETDAPVAVGKTFLPSYDEDAAPAVPRASLGRLTLDEKFVRVGSVVSGLALAWLITQRLLPLQGLPWFVVVALVTTLAVTAVTAAMAGGAVEARDRVASTVMTVGAATVGIVLVSAVVFVTVKGWQALVNVNFFTQDMSGVGPKDSFDKGGVLHAVVGSLIQVGIAVAITLPLGIGTAVFMTEVPGRFATVVRTVVEAMTALPSIVAGLFIYTVFIVALGYPRSGLAAGLAISVMMLPIIARAADVVLRVVPGGLREASLALGASRWRTVWHVVLPTARSGLVTAVILGTARGIGETSPVLLTSGVTAVMNFNPFSGPMISLPLQVFDFVKSPEPNMIARGFGTAAVLLLLVLGLFTIARLIGGRGPGQLSEAQRKRVAAASADDVVRMARNTNPTSTPENLPKEPSQ